MTYPNCHLILGVEFGVLQVVTTFCLLNMVVAIILNAFTWCYSLEPSEITSELFVNSRDLLHFGVRGHLNTVAILVVEWVAYRVLLF